MIEGGILSVLKSHRSSLSYSNMPPVIDWWLLTEPTFTDGMAERLGGDELLQHVKGALLACYTAVIGRGVEARAKTETNIDIRTVGDLAARKALVDYFRESRLPLALCTEELEQTMTFSQNTAYSAVGDEIDGTYNFHSGLGMLPCGSVIGIAASRNPRFCDFLCCGFLEFNSGNLFHAVKGKGAYVIEGWAKGGKASRQLETSGKEYIRSAILSK